ncbi:MAG: hypothetical protein KC505_04750 [Myxococcales bacterium]|nr:hypothetical protein [Myxococcales bacterium]USN51882.1 MAG: hypothetical protein H6731_05620 [Myxococcales bacterium]
MNVFFSLLLYSVPCAILAFLGSCTPARLAQKSRVEQIIPPLDTTALAEKAKEKPNALSEEVLLIKSSDNNELIDKICAIVDSEPPILLSDVNKKALELQLNPSEALQELLRDRALSIYARRLKFSTMDTHKAAEEHILKIMKENKLNRDQFDKILRGAPYFTTLQQYSYETAFLILKNQIEASIASSIQITDKDAKRALEQNKSQNKKVEVVFVSVLPGKQDNIKTKEVTATSQFSKANDIRKEFLSKKSLKSLKVKYEQDKDVRFSGAIEYEEGVLRTQYEAQLKSDPSTLITKPFVDGGAVVMIVRIEKLLSTDMSETALEKVRNDLYKKAVRQRLEAVTKEILVSVPVKVNCTW